MTGTGEGWLTSVGKLGGEDSASKTKPEGKEAGSNSKWAKARTRSPDGPDKWENEKGINCKEKVQNEDKILKRMVVMTRTTLVPHHHQSPSCTPQTSLCQNRVDLLHLAPNLVRKFRHFPVGVNG